jgi:hypothetical protein
MPLVMISCCCRYGEDHEPKEPRESADDGADWDDNDALQV